MTSPYQITAKNISDLNPTQFRDLLYQLLNSEALNSKLIKFYLNVPTKEYTGDGGEDGRLIIKENFSVNRFIQSTKNIYQVKATKMTDKACAKELLKKSKKGQPAELKEMVKKAISEGWVILPFLS